MSDFENIANVEKLVEIAWVWSDEYFFGGASRVEKTNEK
jgi:hypothetical protein